MQTRQLLGNYQLFNAKAATGVSNAIDVSDFENIIVAITAPLNATFTFKFQGSVGKSLTSGDVPDFNAAQAVTNHWDYVAAYDLQDPGTIIAGDTGVTIDNAAVAANTRFYVVNTSLLRWFSMSITSYTDGSLTAWCAVSTD